MVTKAKPSERSKAEPKSTRTSVSFPPQLYDTLELIAKEKKVSVAWVVRDATEKYVADQWPLFQESTQ
ncbi:ribbon-helix-helix domain-containing protein [Nitrosovibrio sp. Nv4]|uniref:ribbon-helix-helix domain-containing protein n=1 Tax=Nitrosovibrio sp. Nv4 TaxID=1945880 RepID=UPI000BE3E1B8|nr:CopG family transcriptional regulator [Nitrosovibrio sp. Nv4]